MVVGYLKLRNQSRRFCVPTPQFWRNWYTSGFQWVAESLNNREGQEGKRRKGHESGKRGKRRKWRRKEDGRVEQRRKVTVEE